MKMWRREFGSQIFSFIPHFVCCVGETRIGRLPNFLFWKKPKNDSFQTGVTNFGQTKFGHRVSPTLAKLSLAKPSLAKPSLASTNFGQTKFGHNQVCPNQVWPTPYFSVKSRVGGRFGWEVVRVGPRRRLGANPEKWSPEGWGPSSEVAQVGPEGWGAQNFAFLSLSRQYFGAAGASYDSPKTPNVHIADTTKIPRNNLKLRRKKENWGGRKKSEKMPLQK